MPHSCPLVDSADRHVVGPGIQSLPLFEERNTLLMRFIRVSLAYK